MVKKNCEMSWAKALTTLKIPLAVVGLKKSAKKSVTL